MLLPLCRRLAADKEDKDNAIALDAASLNLTAGDPIHLQEAGSLQKKVFAYPHNWYKGTGQGVQDARHLQNDAAKLRCVRHHHTGGRPKLVSRDESHTFASYV